MLRVAIASDPDDGDTSRRWTPRRRAWGAKHGPASQQGNKERHRLDRNRTTCSLHCVCLAAARVGAEGELGFHRRCRAQRRSPLVVRGRLPELRCRARPHLPTTISPAQRVSPHGVGCRVVRSRPNDSRRQRLEPLVVPPLRLDHLGALLLP
eukprot:scaffold28881_cov71-Phaeocystis_antarctica.AAC.2